MSELDKLSGKVERARVVNALESYFLVAEAIVRLFGADVEVVVHDAGTGRIAYIANAMSKRRAGDESLIEMDPVLSQVEVVGPYPKSSWNGHRIRSVSAPLVDRDGTLIGHMCINHDIEALAHAHAALSAAIDLSVKASPPRQMFENDWREEINRIVSEFLETRRIAHAGLMVDDLDALLGILMQRRMFEIRNATSYVADILGRSRATLYARLKKIREQGTPTATSELEAEK